MHTTVIEAHGLTKRYGDRTVVNGVDVRVDAGECWGLLGPNGAGKTTFLRMLLGQTPPSCGQLRVLGHAIPQQSREMRRRVGVLPQNDNLDPDFTVAENLRTYGDYFALRGPTLERRIDELLVFAALQTRAADTTAVLSGGLQRRLSMVRALINDPELVVLDEPTTGLDPQARQMIWQRLRQLRMNGITLVLTTHYMEEAQRLCDRVTIMDHGRILASDTPGALIRQQIEPHVIEVYGPGAARWQSANGRGLAARSEQVGETVFYYADDERPLLAALQQQHELTFLHRPANLEDVFVKLTGRELRDG